MFPFNLPGPQFLLFFVVLTITVFAAVAIMQHRREQAWPMPKLDASDPYKIACLNSGAMGALQVATMSLIDRNIIEVDGESFKTRGGAVDVRRPIEKELVKHFAKGGDASAIESAANDSPACEAYDNELKRLRLISGPEVRATRWPTVILGVALVEAVAVVKVFTALAAGRSNVLFLVILAAIAAFLFIRLVYMRKTALGRKYIATQQSLFKGLKQRAGSIQKGGGNADLAILAAVFGLAAVPAMAFPFVDHLAVKRTGSGDGGGDSGSSESGGCGGGGGCGGCGS